MFLPGFRRKLTALALCKSIESAIQWFQIHHRITFATISNPAVYLSGARVSIFSTLVPRLAIIEILPLCWHGLCDIGVTLCNVSGTLSKKILDVHPRSESTELSEAVPIGTNTTLNVKGNWPNIRVCGNE